MAALTRDRQLPNQVNAHPSGFGFVLELDVTAATEIFKGSIVEEGTAGIIPCDGTDGSTIGGIALEGVDNPGAAGVKTCKVHIGGVYEHVVAASSFTDIGALVYAADDQVLTLTATDANAGRIVGWNFVTGVAIVQFFNWATAAPA